ncbi:MAG: relaxase/mobilization nuclease domain-containing protein [Bacteroidota bacterium]
MVIKSLRHKAPSFKKLIEYIANGSEERQILTRNLRSTTMQGIVNEYYHNDQFRSNYSKTLLYHTILSFSPDDTPLITDEMIYDLTNKYIDLRNPNALTFAAIHKDTNHYHVHVALSGCERNSSKVLRLDDKQFWQIRQDLEAYQKEKYPQLLHSLVYLGKERGRKNSRTRDRNTRKEKEYQRSVRTKAPSEKEQLTEVLSKAYASSFSREEFYQHLENEGLELYHRNGQTVGVRGKRKYRFSTLGFSQEKFEVLDRTAQRWEHEKNLAQEVDEQELEW